MDEVTISRAIVESYMKDFMRAMETDVAIAGAGPAGLATAYYLAKEGIKGWRRNDVQPHRRSRGRQADTR